MTDTPAPAEVDPLELVARELHEFRRTRRPTLMLPAWDDLDLTDPWERGARDLALSRASDLVAMQGDGAPSA